MNPGVGRRSVLLPCVLAFLGSAGVMSIEMVAGRLMSIYAGAGLYTWTSVIGVVLGGITAGNLIGGRLADRFPAREALSALFFGGMGVCLLLPFANYWVGRQIGWNQYSELSFPIRIFLHVSGAFLLPATVLGMMGPVVVKLALEGGGGTGRTIGRVYASGAFGSIVGTFLSGYYLIGLIGTSGVALSVAALLGLQALLLLPGFSLRLLAVSWPLLLGLLAASGVVGGRGRGKWMWTADGPRVYETGSQSPRQWIFAKESQYSFVRVAEERGPRTTRLLIMDNLLHAIYAPKQPQTLLYDYERLYHLLTRRHVDNPLQLNFFFIGGGGYVFPRHVRRIWPSCEVQVAEIDPVVTEANFEAFGLSPDEVLVHESGVAMAQSAPRSSAAPETQAPAKRIEIFHLDARNHVDDLVRQRSEGQGFKPFDFIYGDAFNDYCVPQHLVTEEFMVKLRDLLVPGRGIYLMNVIDIYESGLFLGSIYNTLAKVFPRVYIFTSRTEGPSADRAARETWILAASLRELDLADLGQRPGEEDFQGSMLTPEHIQTLVRRSGGLVLTDDYAPVENLLAPVVRRRSLQEVK